MDEIKTPDQAAQLRELEAQLTRLEDAYLAGQWDLARYTDRKRQIDSQLAKFREDQLEAELRELTRERTNDSLKELQAIPDLITWFITSDPTEVNQRLHFLIDHITVSEEEIKIVLK